MAEHLNLVKQRLDETLRALDERRVTAADVTPAKDNWIGTTLLRYALHECGRSRLSRRQAVRQIRIESAAPVRASFFWAHLPRRYRTTVAELEAFLRARLDKNPSVRVDLDALEAFYRLPDSDACRLTAETQIIIERPFHLHPRCNLTFVEASGPDATRRVTRVRRAVLPILYPVAADNTVPEVHSALRPYAEPAPRKRRDDYLVGAPLGLKGIHVYRTRQVDPGVS
ncbi:MAG: hypothetical protein EOM91_16750 [Sphingobacteriia bacterium]|nr:hypothetical protein [Sphingobacteriia bacterium]